MRTCGREETVAELSRRFGISRKTGYKWIGRYMAGTELTDRSRRPHRSPNAVAQDMEDFIVAARKVHTRWGPQKLREALVRANPGVVFPSAGTFALIFTRNGLVRRACQTNCVNGNSRWAGVIDTTPEFGP